MTTWGAWSSNNRLRVGLDMSYSPAVSAGTAAVTVSWTLTGQSRYASYEYGSGITDWAISGSRVQSGSTNGWSVGAMGTWTIASGTFSVATSYTSATTVTLNGNFTSGAAYPGTKPTVSMSITVPRRPYTAPAAPSGVGRTRVSDANHTVTWTNNPTTGAPYANLYLERWDNVSAIWAARATLAGSATSFSDTTTVANRTYQWRIRASNSAGYSGYAYSTAIKTTPAAPGTPTATKDASGNIVVTWSGNPAIGENIEVWHAANGTWDGAPLATLGMVGSYTHATPNASQTHKYRLRSKIASPALVSAYTADSNTVQLLAAPNAPTSLTPSGSPRDAATPIVLSWTHNPADTTPQTAYEVQSRVDGGAWSSTGKVTSTTRGHTVAAGTWINGHTVEWQVRTWGSHANPSPWSATAVIQTSSPPAAVINVPEDGVAWVSSKLIVSWGFSDPEGGLEAAWRVEVLQGGQVVETKTGVGEHPPAGVAMSTTLRDAGTYAARVTVQDSTGLWSDGSAVAEFPVAFAEPPTPVVTCEWSSETGSVAVSWAHPDPVSPEPDPVSVTLLRQIGPDGSWVVVAEGLLPNSATVDRLPALGVVNRYKVITYSALPSSSESAEVEVLTSGAKHAFLNAGVGFAETLRLRHNVDVTIKTGRARRERRSAGREYPTFHDGSQRSKTISVSSLIWNPRRMPDRAAAASTWAEIERFADLPSPACYRDLDGSRVFVGLGEVTIANLTEAAQVASWDLTADSYAEDVYAS